MSLINELEALKITFNEEDILNFNAYKDFFQNFFKKYPPRDITKIINIEFSDLIIATFIDKYPDKALYIKDLFTKYASFVSDLASFNETIEYLLIYLNCPEIEDYTIYKSPLKFISKFKSLYEFYRNTNITTDTLMDIWKFIDSNPQMIKEFKPILTVDLDFFNAVLLFYKELEDFKYGILEKDSNVDINLVYKYIIADNYDLLIASFLPDLQQNYLTTSNEFEKKRRIALKNNKKIADLIKGLSIEGEIKDAANLINLCPDASLKEKIADYIIMHNEKYYETLITALNNLETSTDSNLQILFKRYHYDYNLLNKEEQTYLKTINYKTTENIFQILSSLKLHLPINYIPYISLDKLLIINDLIKSAYLNEDWLLNHLDILTKDNLDLEIVLTNIDLLNKLSINIKNYQNSLDILLFKSLNNNLSILESYGKYITKDTTNINFLTDEFLIPKLDLLIELDLHNLDLLNNSLNDIYLFKLAQELNVSPLLLDDSFIYLAYSDLIPPSTLELLKKDCSNTVSLPESLMPYVENNNLLNIKGLKVSIRRFLTNLSKLPITNLNIFYALIYNSYYSIEEINILNKEILANEDIFTLIRKVRS